MKRLKHFFFYLTILLFINFSCSSCQPKRKTKKEASSESVKHYDLDKKGVDENLSESNKVNSTDSTQNSISFCSWNLKDFGNSKSDSVIDFIATIVNGFDILAIQEVVAKDPGGAQSVARLAEALNRKGAKWDYVVSNQTSGTSYKSERYAFIWKTKKVTKVGDAWLEKKYSLEIDREPYFITFKTNDKFFTLVNFHAITKSKQPETEIKYFKFLPEEYPDFNLIFVGDFNCPQTHTVFNPLKKMGYAPVFISQKTSLRKKCINNDCLASEFDNVFYNVSKVEVKNSGIIHFYKSFTTLLEAESVSDHIPVYFQFSVK